MLEQEGQLFDWDINKNLSNIEKHGVPFKEAATVFRDNAAVVLDDTDHAQDEERFKIIGHSGNLRLLMVCHCYRDDDSIIRIIFARKATKGNANNMGEVNVFDEKIDTCDIPEITDFSNARPNPYANKISKHGYSIIIHYSAEDVAKMTHDAVERIKNLDMLELDPDELAALEKYRKANTM